MQEGEAYEGFSLSPPEGLKNETPPQNSLENKDGGDTTGENGESLSSKSSRDNKQEEIELLQTMLNQMTKGTMPENLNTSQIQKPERKGFLKGIFELIKSILRIFGFSINLPQSQAV